MDQWIKPIQEMVIQELKNSDDTDDSHGFYHLCRVSELAVQFAKYEGGNELVAFAAGMLHDIITLPKNHPESNKSSRLAASHAENLLIKIGFPKELIPNTCHSIQAHSFSAKIAAETIEAKCVQDADRMEALGVFGLMRVFYCCGMYRTKIMDVNDPEANYRTLNDKKFALDHFKQKLFTLYETMQTKSGKQIAFSLSEFLKDYYKMLIDNQLDGNLSSGRYKIAHAYKNAGKQGQSLFHATDPMGTSGRHFNPSKYALDNLLHNNDPYICKFLDQFRFEWNGYKHTGFLMGT